MTGILPKTARSDETEPSAEPDWTRLLFARADPDAERRACEAMALSVDHTLHMACALTKSGRPVDLGGLENWIGRLTASALDLEPADGRQIRQILIKLVGRIDRLDHAIRSRAPPKGGN